MNRCRINMLVEQPVHYGVAIVCAQPQTGRDGPARRVRLPAEERVVWVALPDAVCEDDLWMLVEQGVRPWCNDLAEMMRTQPFPAGAKEMEEYMSCMRGRAGTAEKAVLVLAFSGRSLAMPVRERIACLIESVGTVASFVLLFGERGEMGPEEVGAMELNGLSLGFCKEEIRVYYRALGIALDETALNAVTAVTEGWAAAVHLLALQLQRGGPADQTAVDSGVTRLLHLFEKAFFSRLTPRVQQALVLLSLLEEAPEELSAALTDLSGQELLQIFQDIPFIRYRDESGAFYFHHLFHRFLETKQLAIPTKQRHAFLRKAAGWFGEKGRLREAVLYYTACGDYGRVEKALAGSALLGLCPAEAGRIAGILEQVPEHYLQEHPMLWFYLALLDQMGEMRVKKSHLLRLREHLAPSPASQQGRRAMGESDLVCAFLALVSGDIGFANLLKRASVLLPEGSSTFGGTAANMVGGASLVNCGVSTAPEIKEAFLQSAPYFSVVFRGWGSGTPYLAAAEIDYYRGDLPAAARWAGEALSQAAASGQWDVACGACYLLFLLSLAKGRLDEVEYHRDLIRRYSAMADHEKGAFRLGDIADLHIYHHMGQIHMSAQWIRQGFDPDLGRGAPGVGRQCYAQAVFLVDSKQYYQALTLIDTAIGVCTDTGQWLPKLKLILLKAVVYRALEHRDIGARLFREACELAGENEIIMPFIELGVSVGGFLKTFRHLPTANMPTQWLDRMEREAQAYTKAIRLLRDDYLKDHVQDQSVLQRLTRREAEALRLLCRGLSNAEIAARMVIEPGSVRILLSRMYQKLGAAGRADALRIGLSQGIK